MNIIEAIKDKQLFREFLDGDDLSTWHNWMTALRAVYGLPIRSKRGKALVDECTGRDVASLPKEGFDTALFLVGRRSGKSRMAAVIGAFEAVLAGHHKKLSKGETGVVAVLAPSKYQGGIVKSYLRAVFETPMLAREVVRETTEGFELRNGVTIRVFAGDYKTVRGPTLLAAIVDEICFFGYDAESKIKSDTELVRAIKPGLATTGGKFIGISSPYAKKGWAFNQYKKQHSNPNGTTLVWNCPSRTMNETLPQKVVDQAVAEDLQAAKSEYLGEFRDDISGYCQRATIEALVVKGRTRLRYSKGTKYVAFADLSGGRNDDAALCIAHREDRKVLVDGLWRWAAPHNPYSVIKEMSERLKEYGLKRCTGDRYAAEFVVSAFMAHRIRYKHADLNRSQLYLEMLPRLSSGEIELVDNETLVDQLASLERKTRSGGRDTVDHPQGGHDDLANVVAGASATAARRGFTLGALPGGQGDTDRREVLFTAD